ncbi:hypothetical protein L915_11523, partial [Phytophthora nicotianae]
LFSGASALQKSGAALRSISGLKYHCSPSLGTRYPFNLYCKFCLPNFRRFVNNHSRSDTTFPAPQLSVC